MTSRIASAAIGLPLLILFVWIGSPWFSILVAMAAAIGALELSNISRQWGGRPLALAAVVLAIALVALAHLAAGADSGWRWVVPAVTLGAVASVAWLTWRAQRGTKWSALGVTAAVALYTGGFLFHAPLLRALEQGRQWVLFLVVVTFATDTGAFFVGRAIGRRPLAPTVSPSKTWEGAIGGLAAALGASVGAAYLLALEAGVAEALALGAVVGIAGQLGDLAESRLKRIAGVKDSGWLVLGHGGILDRLDSIVFNLVVVYYFVR